MNDTELATQFTAAIVNKNYSLAGEISHKFNSLDNWQKIIDMTPVIYAKWSNLEAIQFCLTSPLLLSNTNIHFNNDCLIQQAAIYYEFDIVKYLLTSPDLKEHANINEPMGTCLTFAAEVENIELVKYFLFSKELKENADIHLNKDFCFKNACMNNKQKSIDYFLFEYNIPKTHSINDFINKNERFSYLHKIFEKRDLYNSLNNTIPNKTYNNSFIKI